MKSYISLSISCNLYIQVRTKYYEYGSETCKECNLIVKFCKKPELEILSFVTITVRKEGGDLKLYIKYMLTNQCKAEVKAELRKLGLHFIVVDLGEIEIMEELSSEGRLELKAALFNIGFELMDDKKAILIDRISSIIIDMVHNSNQVSNLNFSEFLSKKLGHHYNYLSNIFSEVKGITIQQFMIIHKIERIKELLMYNELNLTEISYLLNYSSVAHLSNQFKKITGLTPSQFKQLKDRNRMPIEEIGNTIGSGQLN